MSNAGTVKSTLFAEAFAAAEAYDADKAVIVLWDVFPGQDPIRLVETNNILTQLNATDAGGIRKWIDAMIHPDDRSRFWDTVTAIPNLDPDTLTELVKEMTEAIAARPTRPQSPSRRSPATQSSK